MCTVSLAVADYSYITLLMLAAYHLAGSWKDLTKTLRLCVLVLCCVTDGQTHLHLTSSYWPCFNHNIRSDTYVWVHISHSITLLVYHSWHYVYYLSYLHSNLCLVTSSVAQATMHFILSIAALCRLVKRWSNIRLLKFFPLFKFYLSVLEI